MTVWTVETMRAAIASSSLVTADQGGVMLRFASVGGRALLLSAGPDDGFAEAFLGAIISQCDAPPAPVPDPPTEAEPEQVITWNPADKAANVILSDGDRTMACGSAAFGSIRATQGRADGKRCFEIEIVGLGGSARSGIASKTASLDTYVGNSPRAAGIVWGQIDASGWAGQPSSDGDALAVGDRFLWCIDCGAGEAWIAKNGVFRRGGDPALKIASSVSGITGLIFPAASSYNPGTSFRLHADADTIVHALPVGFISWAAASMPGYALLGDSLTALGNWPELTGCEGVRNFGIGSDTTAGMLSRIADVLDSQPNAVFVMGGVNDITLGLTREQTRDNLVALVTQIQAAGIPAYVEAITPVTDNYGNPSHASAFNAEIDARNAMIGPAVTAAGATFINWRSSLSSVDFSSDGIHYTASGKAKRAAALSSYAPACG